MVIPTHVRAPNRSRIDRTRNGERDVAALVIGVSIFLMIAAAGLYWIARAAA